MRRVLKNIFKKRIWVIKYQHKDSAGTLKLTGNYFTCIRGIWRFFIRKNYPWHHKNII